MYARLRKLSSPKNTFPFFLIYEIKSKFLYDQAQFQKIVHHNIPTFVDLQGFIEKKFVVKEVAVLRKRTILFHYIFTCPMPWNFLTKSEKYCASWLSAYHHGLQWEDGMIPYSTLKCLINYNGYNS